MDEFYIEFVCPQCGIIIQSFQQWQEHLEEERLSTPTDLKMHRIADTKNHYCIVCKTLFCSSNKEMLQRHFFSHLPFKYYFKCAFCTVKKRYKVSVLNHCFDKHPQEIEAFKSVLKMPVEWGATLSKHKLGKLKYLIPSDLENPADIDNKKENCENKRETSATAEDARNCNVDCEDYMNATKKSSSIEYALDKSLNGLKILLGTGLKSQSQDSSRDSQPPNEFEELCIEILEQQKPVAQDATMKVRNRAEGDEPAMAMPLGDLKSSETKAVINNQLNVTLWRDAHITYICPECSIEFEKQKLWKNHVFNVHKISEAIETKYLLLPDQRSYLCQVCNSTLTTISLCERQRHYFTHLAHQEYIKCVPCNVTKSSKAKMLQHLLEFHIPPPGQIHNQSNNDNNAVDIGGTNVAEENEYICQRSHLKVSRFHNSVDNLKLMKHLKEAQARLRRHL